MIEMDKSIQLNQNASNLSKSTASEMANQSRKLIDVQDEIRNVALGNDEERTELVLALNTELKRNRNIGFIGRFISLMADAMDTAKYLIRNYRMIRMSMKLQSNQHKEDHRDKSAA